MATKLKHDVTFTVHTLGGSDFTAADTATSKDGTHARFQFEHGDTVRIPGASSDTLIPYHAIEYVTISSVTDSVTYDDDTCVPMP